MNSYQKRQHNIMQVLTQDDLFMVTAQEKQMRNMDVYHPFRQASDFLYLTGWHEANAALVITHEQAFFFCQEQDPVKILWQGDIIGLEQAKQITGLSCYPISNLTNFVKQLNKLNLYHLGVIPAALQALPWQEYQQLANMRLIKDQQEIGHINTAIIASINGHQAIMKALEPGISERELYGVWLYELCRSGMQHEAYPAIIAAGMNACTLHYQALASKCQAGQLLLVDAGMEYHGYAADLTRTIPVSGKFSPAQSEVYRHVLAIQAAAVAFMQPGRSMTELNSYVRDLYVQALVDLGVTASVMNYAPHGIGHALGLDVHDVGLNKDMALPIGAVITIEPGLYFRDTKYSGIGVRIEDNYLMTENGLKCLSNDLPKTIPEIEEMCASV